MNGLEQIILEYFPHRDIKCPHTSIHTGRVNPLLPANHFSHTVFERFQSFDRQVGRTFQIPQPHSSVVGTSRQHRFVQIVTKSSKKFVIILPTSVDSRVMAREFTDYLTCCHVPDKRVFVPSHWGKSVVVSRYREVQDFLVVRTTVLFYLSSFKRVPKYYRSV